MKFIKLTLIDVKSEYPFYLSVDKICFFNKSSNPQKSGETYLTITGRNKNLYVRESPEEILELINCCN